MENNNKAFLCESCGRPLKFYITKEYKTIDRETMFNCIEQNNYNNLFTLNVETMLNIYCSCEDAHIRDEDVELLKTIYKKIPVNGVEVKRY